MSESEQRRVLRDQLLSCSGHHQNTSLHRYTKLAWAAVPSLKEEFTAGSGSSLKCSRDKADGGSPFVSHMDLA
jgi:hypothetical protein